jgi:hypothetical protein
MRERMSELSGELQIESDGRGTTMRATVPLSAMSRSVAEIGAPQGSLSRQSNEMNVEASAQAS